MGTGNEALALPGFIQRIRQQKSNIGWLVCTVCTASLLSIPVVTVLYSITLPASDLWSHLRATVLADYALNSFVLAAGVCIGTSLIGITTAWLCSACNFPGRKIFSWTLLLPLAFPPYIIAYTYTGMLDFAGPVQTLMRNVFDWGYGDYWFPEIRSIPGAIIMISLVLYPYVYLLLRTAFSEQSASLREASHMFGVGSYTTLFSIILPLARPALVAGLTLVVMETLADYGTVHYFGVPTFTTGILRTWFGLGDRIAATQLASLLLLCVFAVILAERYTRKAVHYQNPTKVQKSWCYPLSGVKAILAFVICSLPVFLVSLFLHFNLAHGR